MQVELQFLPASKCDRPKYPVQFRLPSEGDKQVKVNLCKQHKTMQFDGLSRVSAKWRFQGQHLFTSIGWPFRNQKIETVSAVSLRLVCWSRGRYMCGSCEQFCISFYTSHRKCKLLSWLVHCRGGGCDCRIEKNFGNACTWSAILVWEGVQTPPPDHCFLSSVSR